MSPLTADKLHRAQALCQHFGVRRLDVFGSASTADFDPARSDVDFIVEFERTVPTDIGGEGDLFGRYFGLKASLEGLFGCSVDLVMAGAMRNPFFIESANRTRRPVYESPLATAA